MLFESQQLAEAVRNITRYRIQLIATDEANHVSFLRTVIVALGGTPITVPATVGVFDYSEGSVTSLRRDLQTTLVPAGGATITEFKLDYPGSYLLVDQALSRVGKGLVGAIEVSGAADPDVYKVGNPGGEL